MIGQTYVKSVSPAGEPCRALYMYVFSWIFWPELSRPDMLGRRVEAPWLLHFYIREIQGLVADA
jgi:hypothetical protein